MQYPYVVPNIKRNMITVFNKDSKHTLTKNISFFKIVPMTAKAPRVRIAIEEEEEDFLSQVPQ